MDVLLEAGAALPDELTGDLFNHLDGARADLELPGPLRLSTGIAALPDDAIRVTTNGDQFLLGAATGWDVVASAMHVRRHAWVDQAPAGSTDEGRRCFLSAARELVRRGVAVSRLSAARMDVHGDDPSAAAEEAIAGTTARMSVRYRPGDRDVEEWLDSDRLGLLPQVLWAALGLVVPDVVAEPEPELTAGTVQVVINDVRLPAVGPPGGDLGWPILLSARQHAGSLLTRQIVSFQLDRLAELYPELVVATRKRWSDGHITVVLRELLDEGVRIGDLRAILEACLEGAQHSGDSSDLAAAARPRIGLALVRPYVTGGGTLRVTRLRCGWDRAKGRLSDGSVAVLHQKLAEVRAGEGSVLLTDSGMGPVVRDAVRIRFPGITLITEDELPPGVRVDSEDELLLQQP